jgi:tricorn protease
MRFLLPFIMAGATFPAVHAQTAPAPPRGYYRFPALHGRVVVFTAEGDLWTAGIEGGPARRLTAHPGEETHAAISPDGKTVAFTAEYEGTAEVYTMPIEGGLPQRRTWDGESSTVVGWSRDNKVLYSTRRYSTLPNAQLVSIDAAGRKEVIPLAQAADGDYDATGRTLFFTRQRFQGSNTKRYRGGTAQNIWRYTAGEPEAVALTADYTGTSRNPLYWNGRVYFLSDRDGNMNIWSMDAAGKNLKQHTRHKGFDAASPSLDEGRMVYQHGADLWLLDLRTGRDAVIPIQLISDFDNLRDRWVRKPMEYLTSVSLSPDGDRVVLTARGEVFVAPVKPGRLVRVAARPSTRYRSARMLADGKNVIALSSESGELEFWRFAANGLGTPERLTNDGKVLRWDGVPSPDGKWLAHYDKDQQLWLLDLKTKQQKLIARTESGGGFEDLQWSPDSGWLAYVEEAANTFLQIKLYGVANGSITAVSTDRYNSHNPAWSPDGQWLYFLSDRSLRTAVFSPWGPRQPDPFFDRSMKIYELALKKGLRSPFLAPDEVHPAESGAKSEGKKGEAAKPDGAKGEAAPAKDEKAGAKPAVTVTVDGEGIQARISEVPAPPGNYSSLAAFAKRLCWTDRDRGPQAKTSLQCLDIGSKPETPETVMSEIRGFVPSPDGKKMLIRKGEEMYVVESTAKASALSTPKSLTDARVNLSDWSFAVSPVAEFRELFADAWRLERDYFYDRKMHGVDWAAMKAKYLPLVDRVTDRAELNDVIAQMVAELSALHIFVYGGDQRRAPDQVRQGGLGALFDRDEAAGGLRVKHIYRSDPDLPDDVAPLARPEVAVAEGDVIVGVDDTPALQAQDIGALLRDKAGKQVLLQVKAGAGGAGTGEPRMVVVKPIGTEKENALRYGEWEYTRRLKVDEMGGGRIGYVHLRAMGPNDIEQWVREFYPVFNRQGLIIDVRHNRGGNIDSWLLSKLMRKAWFYWQGREGTPTWNMQYAFRGHMVVLCDEYTASDGEAFTEGFRRLGLGKAIGTRTWGGEIWLSSSNYLADQGIATAAETGVYSAEGKWLIEGHGVDPDMVIDNLPHATFNGKDAQLEAAVNYLKEKIRADPVEVPKAPTYPDKSFRY